jgi:hypothetical protein
MARLLPDVAVAEPELQVVVPSFRRPGRVLVAKMLPPEAFVVVVPPDQLAAYEAAQPDLQYVAYPLPEGDMSRKLQWMYDRFGSMLVIDDDLDRVQHNEHVVGEPTCNLTPEDAWAVFRRTAWETAQLGKYLFGFGDGDIRNFEDHKPFKTTSLVASAIGLLAGSGLTFNSEIRASEDFWITLLNAYRHRIAWIDWRYTPQGPPVTFKNPGGMSAVRTLDTERHDFEVLKRYFGGAVSPKSKTGRARPSHQWQRTITLPYEG